MAFLSHEALRDHQIRKILYFLETWESHLFSDTKIFDVWSKFWAVRAKMVEALLFWFLKIIWFYCRLFIGLFIIPCIKWFSLRNYFSLWRNLDVQEIFPKHNNQSEIVILAVIFISKAEIEESHDFCRVEISKKVVDF